MKERLKLVKKAFGYTELCREMYYTTNTAKIGVLKLPLPPYTLSPTRPASLYAHLRAPRPLRATPVSLLDSHKAAAAARTAIAPPAKAGAAVAAATPRVTEVVLKSQALTTLSMAVDVLVTRCVQAWRKQSTRTHRDRNRHRFQRASRCRNMLHRAGRASSCAACRKSSRSWRVHRLLATG